MNMNMTYDGNGNLLNKTITGSTSTGSLMSYRDIAYNSDNKPIQIDSYDGTSTTFAYGSDGMRYKQQTAAKTTYYIGSYEVEVDRSNNEATTRAYIGSYALKSRLPNGSVELHFLHKDRLGSVDTITDGNTYADSDVVMAMAIEQRSFDVFGKARTTTGGVNGDGLLNSDITQRGFTNHEHLGESGLIHMNGRAYDPDLGRFMSVDPFVTFPDDGQSLNPYSYVMNNPLKYTDPSGYSTKQADYSSNCEVNCATDADKDLVTEVAQKYCESDCTVIVTKNADGKVIEVNVLVKSNGNNPTAANDSSSGSNGSSSGSQTSGLLEKFLNLIGSGSGGWQSHAESFAEKKEQFGSDGGCGDDCINKEYLDQYSKLTDALAAGEVTTNVIKVTLRVSSTTIKKAAVDETTTVGQWMSKPEFDKFVKDGVIPRTNVLTNGPSGYIKQANVNDLYVEFDVLSSLLVVKNKDLGWSLVKSKNKMYIKLAEKKGETLPAPIGINIQHKATKFRN